jgi:cyclopropane fatty-acyl-phospholipid synthase-like methyltransferase
VLDVGCGTGEHALMAAARGLEAWDRHFPNGDAIAGEKAIARGFSADFRVWNALNLKDLGDQFDTVIDSALFHVFDDDERGRYVSNLRAALSQGGRS